MFYQAETGWQAPAWLSFDSLVHEVVMHRRANAGRFPNLSQDRATVEAEVDAYNTERMKSIDGGNAFIQDGGSAPPNFPMPLRQARAEGDVAGAVKNAVAGIATWLEWFGDEPVAKFKAEGRAAVCVACPLNVRGNVLQRFNAVTGQALTSVFAAMHSRKMLTPFDNQLGVCDACDCPMKAKVWTPIKIIANHLRPEAREKLWAECWMRKELLSVENPIDSSKSE